MDINDINQLPEMIIYFSKHISELPINIQTAFIALTCDYCEKLKPVYAKARCSNSGDGAFCIVLKL